MVSFSKINDPILSDLARRFLHRDLFKPVAIKNRKEKKVVRDMVKGLGFDSSYYFLEDEKEKKIYHPNPIESNESQGIKILISKDENLMEISEVSRIIGKLGKTSYSQKKYVYVPYEVREKYFSEGN